MAPQHAGRRVLSLVQRRCGLGQGPDPWLPVQNVVSLLLLLLLAVTRFDQLAASSLEVPRVRFKTAFPQVLLPSQGNRDGDFQRRVLDEVIIGPVARRAHVRVHVVPVLQLAL